MSLKVAIYWRCLNKHGFSLGKKADKTVYHVLGNGIKTATKGAKKNRHVSYLITCSNNFYNFFSLFQTSTLPIPDTKGISSSLAILANCLEQMSVSEYVPLAQMYGLTASHPLLQAYYCSYESAMRSQYTPLFYARHKVSPAISLT